MTATPLASQTLWPALFYAVLVFVITATILALTHMLGQRHREPRTGLPYESGIDQAGPLPRRLSVEFYQVAIFFVVFDLEAVFIFAWAVDARRLGWSGYVEIAVFVTLLLAGLVYLWKVGGLDWATSERRPAARHGSRE